MRRSTKARWIATLLGCLLAAGTSAASADEGAVREFFASHCLDCHNADTQEGGLDLTSLKLNLSDTATFSRWVRIHDRLKSGEMPPKTAAQPNVVERTAMTDRLAGSLIEAERAARDAGGRTVVRRLTREEYENTIRDLFGMSGVALVNTLPADGSAHGFDNNADALDISHVNMAKYMEAADHTLDLAIATQSQPPTCKTQRVSMARHVGHILGNGDAVLLRDKQPDPEYPPAGEHSHIDQGAHERLGLFNRGSSVGVFRHEGESFHPYFLEFAALYPGRYRVRASFWSFHWDKGRVLPSRGVEAARLSVVQLQRNGRHGGHPSYVLGYFDAPSIDSQVHEVEVWLNYKDAFGFNAASLAPVVNYSRKGRAMAFVGPGIACDWLDVEGPLHDVWPPPAHRALFGDLPIVEFKREEHPGVAPPQRTSLKQEIIAVTNRPDPTSGVWTVHSDQPLQDADRLLAGFLPRAFRRPVSDDVRAQYVAKVAERLEAGDCFELAMRWVYRAALCSPDFLYHVEPAEKLDDYALASRLSYFFWNSMPDERLTKLAASGKLRDEQILHDEVERMLRDDKSQRFVDNFLGQWLKLRKIAANDPDRKLYPEFSAYLQDSMVAETRAYFRELLDENLDASHLVRSDFAMLNEKLAAHYGVEGVSGPQIRRVELPKGSPRGGFLTQASILKITANGTTTSPVPRGAFVMEHLLGEPPPPPPPNVAAIEPDVRGASTIREQLAKHRSDAVCATCHAKMDPPGFALESFDVIGGFRERYRSIGEGDKPERGKIDPFIPLSFRLGPAVDASGELPDGRKFDDIRQFQDLLAADTHGLLTNLARQLAVYSTGRAMTFSDRQPIESLVSATEKQGGGIRTLIHELVQSELFHTR
ncbi:MAG: DUF1592 domain-containing protein [Pirellulaceae bacterium]